MRGGLRSLRLTMRRLLRNSIAAIAMICGFAACDKDMVYYSYQHVGNVWRWSDTLFFDLNFKDSLQPICFEADVRFKEAYPFKELTLAATHNLQDSLVFVTDTIRIAMTDENGTRKASTWSYYYMASGRLGVMRMAHPGNYRVMLSPLASDSTVTGLTDVGLRLMKVPEQ
jgi:gliding motility-associated lipoprotein GldH